ncbi:MULTISPECIES: DMT family transporter [unclassified Anaeromyxobacter]|uniref:DMT family transporter n=1 Tax=unclassified Anaeromyxobacter TaxID=2620896 RepID=UPI001F58DE3D|nr:MULTISPECIES: DMT family transporter [unclassified Anaeromyxobacter]
MSEGGGRRPGAPASPSRGAGTKFRARLLLLGSAASFGLMAVLARLLSTRGETFSAGQLTVVRFVVGAAVSLVAFRVRPGLYRPHNRRLLWTRGVSGGIVVVLYFLALQRIPAGEAGMLYNLFPVIATVLSIRTFGERPTIHLLLALLLATFGVALVLGNGSLRLGLGAGEALAVGAAVFAALSAVVIRAMRATDNAATIFFYFSLGGLPVALPFALGPWPTAPGPWAIAAVMGLAAYSAQVLMTEAYGALSVGEAAVWLQLTPLAQYLLAAVLLGERVSAAGGLGMLVGVAGVAYGTVLGHRPRSAVSPPRPGVPR